MDAEGSIEPGTIVADRYRVERLLGTGGFGEVFFAVEEALDRPVALKLLHASDGNDTLRTRFKREAKLIARLSSPNTVRLYDFGEWDGKLYMILEFVDGRDLVDVIESEGAFDGPRLMKVLQQALRSLSEAHEVGVLHRDIKLQNVMLYDSADQTDLVKVLDFGIARVVFEDEEPDVDEDSSDAITVSGTLGGALTSEGEMIGTPRYMSPEQARGRKLDHTSDLYSLGIVALELVTARPWLSGTPLEIAHQHIKPEPNRVPAGLDLDPDIVSIIERLAEKRPDARYKDAAEALADIDRWERREPLQPVSTYDTSGEFALKPTDLTGTSTARGIPTWMTAVPTRTGKFRYEFEMRNFDEQRLAVELWDTEPMLLRITTVPAQRGVLLLAMPLLPLSLMFGGELTLGAVMAVGVALLFLMRNDDYRVVELTVEGDEFQLEVRDDESFEVSGVVEDLRRVETRDNELWLAAADHESDVKLATISATASNRARWLEGKLNQKLAHASRAVPIETPTTMIPGAG